MYSRDLPRFIVGFDGSRIGVRGESVARVGLAGKTTTVSVVHSHSMLPGVDLIVGMDVLQNYRVTMDRGVVSVSAAAAYTGGQPVGDDLRVEGPNFEAWFARGHWTARWDWQQEPVLTPKIGQYAVSEDLRADFEQGVEKWITNGWLRERKRATGGPAIPLMAVLQEAKGKVRPVLDYREVNSYVHASGAQADVCAEKMREWRRFPINSATIDIRDAYMQVRVSPDCRQHQTVRYKGREYELQRMGFGLNCAPQILKAIVNKVLALDPKNRAATSAYFDDVMVDEDQVSATAVSDHLMRFGLPCKPPGKLGSSTVLGLRVKTAKEGLLWERPDRIVADITPSMTRRQLFSLCGKWIGHFPVAGWLRPAASYVKRLCDGTHGSWDEPIGDEAAMRAGEINGRLGTNDPVRGEWRVRPGRSFTLWCDASSLAMGAALERDGRIVEDMTWLRRKDTALHINVAELTAVVRGVSLALKWGARTLTIVTDSASVHWWLEAMLTGDRRVRVKGDSEMLVRRRLEVIHETLGDYNVEWSVKRVQSGENKADVLTRVPKHWLKPQVSAAVIGPAISQERRAAERAHDAAHRGVDTTLTMAKEILESVTRDDAKLAVRTCELCASINPHPVDVGVGKLGVPEVWGRIAADVTHLRDDKFLTIIDCGPSRYTVWKRVRHEDAKEIAEGLEEAFRILGPPKEAIFDNGLAFRSGAVRSACDKWGVAVHFRCADKPSGNAIVERCHRTIKEIAARRGGELLDAVAMYNMIPRGEEARSPAELMTGRKWNNPLLHQQPNRRPEWRETDRHGPFEVGDLVWVKPPRARCHEPWKEGRVTGINSRFNVEVDGMPRHPRDLRRRSEGWHHRTTRMGAPTGGGKHTPCPSSRGSGGRRRCVGGYHAYAKHRRSGRS